MSEQIMPEKRETQPAAMREEARTATPAVDIFEVPDGLVVLVDLPGVEKGNVDIRVEKDILTIAGKANDSMPGEVGYREFQVRDYFRQFQLTEHVDQEKIRAELKSGVLTLMLPKAEKAKPKKITVNVAS